MPAVLFGDSPFAREEFSRSCGQLIDDTIAEMQTGERYLARPRAEIARLDSARAAIAAERDALRADLERLAGECEAVRKERDAVAQQRDAALAERDALVRALRRPQNECDAASAQDDGREAAPPPGRRKAPRP